jgi:hypothetical protein
VIHPVHENKETTMSTSDLNQALEWHPTRLFAPRRALTCRCADHEVMGWRDEDGDWTCCTCGRPVMPSITTQRAIRSAVRDLQLRAA